MILYRSIIIVEHILPIGIAGTHILQDIIDIFFTSVCSSLLHQGSILLGIEQFALTPRILPSYGEIILNHRLADTTSLGGNKNYTIGCTRTIHSTRSSIFQDFDTLNITRIQIVDTTLNRHSIYDVERVGTIHGTRTTYANLAGSTRLTTGSSNLYTRYQSLESSIHTHRLSFSQFISSNLGNRSGNYALFLRTITYYHHFVEGFSILFQGDAHISRWLHLYILITHISNYQRLAGICLNGEVTIQIGNCTCSPVAFHLDGGTDNRFTLVIQHNTFKDVLLCKR